MSTATSAQMRKAANEAFGARLREFRQARSLTQAEVGSIAGLNRQQVCEIEAGNRSMTATELIAVSREYGADITDWVKS